MDQVPSLAEIEALFESEWALLGDPETTESLQVKSGGVLWHSEDRDEVYRKARGFRPRHSAILYTGKPSKETPSSCEPPLLCHTLPPTATVDGVLGLDFFWGRRLTIDLRQGLATVD